jgi:hypothetical protein
MNSTNHTNEIMMMKNRTGTILTNQTNFEGTNLSNPTEPSPSSPLLKPHGIPETESQADPNLAVLASLIVLILILTIIFLYLVLPPLYRHVRSLIPVNPKRVEARYLTIEGWLISKVRSTYACSSSSSKKETICRRGDEML